MLTGTTRVQVYNLYNIHEKFQLIDNTEHSVHEIISQQDQEGTVFS